MAADDCRAGVEAHGCERMLIKTMARGLPRRGRRATFEEWAGGHRVSGTCEPGALMGKVQFASLDVSHEMRTSENLVVLVPTEG